MERKLLHKRKGQWVALSTSLLAMAITMQSADFVLAQEANSSDQSLVTSQEIDEISKNESSLNIDNEKQEVTPEIDAVEIESIQSALAKPAENSQHTSNLSNQTSLSNPTSASHTVKQGDTLYSLARNNGLTLDQLMAYNNLSSYNIPVGTVLYFTPQAKSNSQVVANQERATTQVVTKLKSDNYSPQEFIAMIAESSKSIAKANDLYPSVMIAQAALESNWGNSKLSKAPNYNLFGVKGSYNGNSVALDTLEDDGTGNYSGVKAKFKAYPSYMQSLLDYANVLTGKDSTWRREYYAGARFSNTNSYKDATAHLTGRYATDTRYGGKLNNLISMYNLTQYDQILFEDSKNSNHNIKDIEDEASKIIKQSGSDLSNQQNNGNQSTGTYTVKKGESLGLISRRYGMTVAQLKALNGLTSELIHPNQVLKVSGTTQESTNSTDNDAAAASETSNSNQINQTANTHTVKHSEYLYLIAKKYGISIPELRALNNLSSNIIKPGQVLKVSTNNTEPSKPEETKKDDSKKEDSKPEINTNAKTHTVRYSEYLYLIAKRYGLSVAELRALNNLSSNIIKSGQVLKVSKGSTEINKLEETKRDDSKKEESKPKINTNAKTHTVRYSEYLYLIAKRYGLSVAELKALNNLSSNIIKSGQVLKVSKGSTEINKPEDNKKDDNKKEESKPEINTNAKTHTVKKGEYLYLIARKYGLTVSKLKALNNLSSNVLLTGQVLKVTKGEIDSTITNPETSPIKRSTDNLPDLSRANAIEVDYDVKLNSKTEPFRTSINLASKPINAVNKFGQRFTVTREFYENGQKYLELSQNGMVKGYVPASAAVKVPKNSKVIYLDAGHGGSETGAYSFGTAEKNLNLNITRRLASDLRKQGYTVYESRTTDKAIPLNQRTIEPNRIMPDLYLSVHHNAMPNPGSARGIETLYHNSSIDEEGYMTMAHHKYTNLQAESKRLADTVQSYLIAETGAVNRGARPQNLHVTRTNDAPAILVELGFQDNYSEYKNLTSPSYQNRLIKGLLKGINAFLN